MKKGFHYALLIAAILTLASCSTTKYVPDGLYLLDEVRIHTDNKNVKFQFVHICAAKSELQMV